MQQVDHLLHPRQVSTQLDEHLGGHPLALPDQARQQAGGFLARARTAGHAVPGLCTSRLRIGRLT
jgi:hypothetical protein